MKQKTKSILAGLSMGLASGAGLACVGIAIWSISNMRHPYINQWVDLAKDKFDPIVSPVDAETIKHEMQIETLNKQTVIDFYLTKLSKTPEIFVEDSLYEIDEYMKTQIKEGKIDFNKNNVRFADVKIKKDAANKYLISFQWTQSLDCDTRDGEHIEETLLDWTITFKEIPIQVNNLGGKDWRINFDRVDDKWSATCSITRNEGVFKDVGTGTWEIKKDQYGELDPYFYEFNCTSYYLSNILIEN